MRLSEAIRLGATMAPQAFGTYRRGDKTCALGEAAAATGAFASPECQLFSTAHVDVWVTRRWPKTLHQSVLCPSCKTSRRLVSGTIVHLNDTHGWTREMIADWVVTIEVPETIGPEAEANQPNSKKEIPVCV